jgi:hypothetical protein
MYLMIYMECHITIKQLKIDYEIFKKFQSWFPICWPSGSDPISAAFYELHKFAYYPTKIGSEPKGQHVVNWQKPFCMLFNIWDPRDPARIYTCSSWFIEYSWTQPCVDNYYRTSRTRWKCVLSICSICHIIT